METNTSKTISEIRQVIKSNNMAGRGTFDGLTSSEIGEYNRRLMFGENYEAFPSQ